MYIASRRLLLLRRGVLYNLEGLIVQVAPNSLRVRSIRTNKMDTMHSTILAFLG